MQPFAPRMLDIFSASDEIEMLRYRLRLHEPIAYRTIILEGVVEAAIHLAQHIWPAWHLPAATF